MANRLFYISEEEEHCVACTYVDECSRTAIDRDTVFQSLKDARLYVYRDCGMVLVKEII